MAEINEIQQDLKKGQFKSLLVENIKYRTILTKKYQDKKPYAPKDNNKITAFIPGKIIKIFVEPKKKVKAGDILLSFEAMKMINQIVAPVDGTIKMISVKEGEKVTKDKLLIELQ
ncbi:MAG: acetyl-CoA carboxylase biotin carboxyl carrier protein subunit [Bacteroidetes bacterium]|nr:acetyl-CoA carboxylase biotin carboxyl carrier protein subunit [Bacteroidota bacterium]